jgi:starch-binding outer membrane protein, SusD/RagB family
MNRIYHYSLKLIILVTLLIYTACQDKVNIKPENKTFNEGIDYTITDNMILPILGLYGEFYDFNWEIYQTYSYRGDDVNPAGDQIPFQQQDQFAYAPDHWNLNNVWKGLYTDILRANSTIEQIKLYAQNATGTTHAAQYIAEAKTIKCWELLMLSRMWGAILVPETSSPADLTSISAMSKDSVMQYISDQMDKALPDLPDIHPKLRTDITGGVTKYTALAIKAIANLELKNYQSVADATSQIIASNKFALDPDFYELFKIPGKLDNENLFEIQYSDYGAGSGTQERYLWDQFGPTSWSPAVATASGGWGFYEPTMKYVKFMLDRGETVRLETSVLFTPQGIDSIKHQPGYSSLPAWISNTTRDGDVFLNSPRYIFQSGKHYLPTTELTPGRTDYGSNKNFTIIRFAEILLMHAEALTQGATSTVMTADAAVNAVRARAGLTALSSVTNTQVMDEKFAELAMEWGIRYWDMVRLGKYAELSYGGRTFTADKIFYPYPQEQVDLLTSLHN